MGGELTRSGWNAQNWQAAFTKTGYPAKADTAKVNWFMAEVLLVIMVLYVTMVYGPIAAYLVEAFPAKIRYTSLSLPYHFGNGWFGGFLPKLDTSEPLGLTIYQRTSNLPGQCRASERCLASL